MPEITKYWNDTAWNRDHESLKVGVVSNHLADVLERHLFDHLEECPDELDPRELAEAVGGEYQSVVRAAALVTAQACLFKSGFRETDDKTEAP